MGSQLNIECYLWFEAQIKKGRFPKLEELMERFELKHRTAQRAIQFMRDRMGAPIEYSHKKKGYCYDDDSFEFPRFRFTEREIIGLLIAERLAHSLPDQEILNNFNSFIKKFSLTAGINAKNLRKKLSIKNIRYDHVEPETFNEVVRALSENLKLNIKYKTKSESKYTCRVVNPLHLLLYMGNWHLLAICELRNELRNFSLSGITHINVLDEEIPNELLKRDIGKLIEDNYGIFIRESNFERKRVVLKFKKNIARIIKNQIWYPGQNLEECSDGSIFLTVTVTDFRELESDILKYGPDVEVLEPAALRDRLKQTIAEMNRIY